MAIYVMTQRTINTKINEIIIIGFKTIGIPKITSSLILKTVVYGVYSKMILIKNTIVKMIAAGINDENERLTASGAESGILITQPRPLIQHKLLL